MTSSHNPPAWFGHAPGVGAEVVQRDGKRYFYVAGVYGLGIYDTTDPLQPALVGRPVFPISQNEDLKVSEDGTQRSSPTTARSRKSPKPVVGVIQVIGRDVWEHRNGRLKAESTIGAAAVPLSDHLDQA